jgi:hypothetical protein
MTTRNKVLIGIFLTLLALGSVVVVVGFLRSGFSRGFDEKFGDQHLKTTVALVELHRLRYGHYPASLDELNYLGDWDPIALNSVKYHANPQRTRYCIEVVRGWVGKPELTMPPEFWRGTGYDPSLCR